MRIKLLIITLAIFFSSTVHAFDLSATAGVYIPSGKNADIYDIGYTLSLTASKDLLPTLDLKTSWVYSYTDGKANGTNYELKSHGIQAMVVFTPPTPVFKPYIGAGYGGYYNKFTETGAQNRNDSSFGHGPVAQAGIGMQLAVVRLGLDAKYALNITDGDSYGNFSVGLSAGLAF